LNLALAMAPGSSYSRAMARRLLAGGALAAAAGAYLGTVTGRLAADLWALGRWWGGVVGRQWNAAVAASLTSIAVEAERRAAAKAAARPPEAST
jgi:hypothetical protein